MTIRIALACVLLALPGTARTLNAQALPAPDTAAGLPRPFPQSLSTTYQHVGPAAEIRSLPVQLRYAWNSQIPVPADGDGAFWAGRGSSGRLRAGAVVRRGPLLLVAAPELHFAQNASFDELLPDTFPQLFTDYTLPWQVGRHRIDQPYRPGSDALLELRPGNSTLAVVGRGAAAGISTEQQWWGPARRNTLVLSDNAPGFPHVFVRTAGPVSSRVGRVNAAWMLGALSPSDTYREAVAPRQGRRSLNAALLSLSPARAPTLTIGAARAVYGSLEDWGDLPGRGLDVLLERGVTTDTMTPPGTEQITALFARWFSPADGAEIYVEWARTELPASLRELALMPEHSQGYTLGASWARAYGIGHVRLGTEFTYLEQSSTYRVRPVNSFYASRGVPEGYTHQGRVLGAAVGPSGSSQYLHVDWQGRERSAGVFAGRTRWNNDAYNDWPGNWPARYQGHEVSLFVGARGTARVAGLRVGAEWATGQRYNFMFQNWAVSWSTAHQSVNVPYHALRLDLSQAASRLPTR